MTKMLKTTLLALLLAPYSYVLSDDEMYPHLPMLDEVKAYFIEHQATLDSLFEVFATDTRVDWLECASDGQHRVTTISQDAEFVPESAQTEVFRESCDALNIKLVQRVDSGISVIWKDLDEGNTKYRIELYGTDKSIDDSCQDHRFVDPISTCNLSLNSRWDVRYIGIVNKNHDSAAPVSADS